MKKTVRYVLFSFMLSCIFILFGASRATASNFWDEVGNDFGLIEQQSDSLVFNPSFSASGYELYNYSFSYDYKIETTGSINDNGSPIKVFYGSDGLVTINYTDIKGSILNPINDKFRAYKYNYDTQEFYTLVCDPGKNKEGECKISATGLYKLITEDVDGTNVAYLLIEDSFASGEVAQVNYLSESKQLEVQVTFKDPRTLSGCGSVVNSTINALTTSYRTCEITETAVDGETNRYRAVLKIDVPSSYKVVVDGKMTVTIYGGMIKADVSYDSVNPELSSSVVYYNKDLISESLSKQEANGMSLPKNTQVQFSVSDDSLIKMATVNGNECVVVNNTETKVANIACEIDSSIGATELDYKVYDNYDNLYQRIISNVSYDETLLNEGDELANHIVIEENNTVRIEFNINEYTDIKQVCILYGNSEANFSECGSVSIAPTYYYKGDVSVIVVDNAMNFGLMEWKNVEFLNGYSQESFTKNDIVGDINSKENIVGLLEDLKLVACNSDTNCKDEHYFVKYGENIEELASDVVELPTYTEILNTKFRDGSCATNQCNKQVEIVYSYSLGGVSQSVSAYLNYVDKLPYIKDSFTYQENVSLEYKSFDIAASDIKQLLYGDELEIVVKDLDDKSYSAKISPVFIEYTDLVGNVSKLENLAYTYISETDKLGVYLLECRIKLLKNVTDDVVFADNTYTKSFFINVSLRDTIMPTLTLIGDAEVEVKQYDVYKDASYNCEDLSGCVVTLKYYLNEENENNVVDSVDTKTAGKYIIKFIAVDADGNEVTAYRVVNVVGVNSLDTNSIIVIVVVIVLFALFITIGVIIEVKKSKRGKRGE